MEETSDKKLYIYDKVSYNKKYYEKHKEKLKEMALKKVKCEYCNKEYSQANWNKHIKSNKHIMAEKISISDKIDENKFTYYNEQINELREQIKNINVNNKTE